MKEFHDLLVPSFNETSYQLRVTEVRPTNELTKFIIAGYAKDKVIRWIRRAIKERDNSSGKKYKPYFEENGLLWYQGSTDEKPRTVAPNIITIKHRISEEIHDSNYGDIQEPTAPT